MDSINYMPRASDNREGLLYLIRLHPAGRYKIGWTETEKSLAGRVKEASAWVPEAEVVASWPALKKWEAQLRYVMTHSASVAAAFAAYPWTNWERVSGGEVVDGCDQDTLIERAEDAIDLLAPYAQAVVDQAEAILRRDAQPGSDS